MLKHSMQGEWKKFLAKIQNKNNKNSYDM